MTTDEVKQLAASGRYRGQPLNGQVEETHISWVILTKNMAFKIKKPVALSFLDFSELANRKIYCDREVQLNQRFSDIYLGVLPLRQENERYTLGEGAGPIIDYAVQMKRLPSGQRMDLLLAEGGVKERHIRQLAKRIADVHARATVITTPFDLGKTLLLFNDITEIRPFVLRHWGEELALIISHSINWSDAFLRTHIDRFQERINQGFQRDVHGDLHSRNIFILRDPVLFDCIEFNDRYRQIDLLYEIAFFCMDLEVKGKDDFSRLFQVMYNSILPVFQKDEDGLIFNYFKCLRANVRAKVHALQARQLSRGAALQHELDEIRAYLQLMKKYLNHPASESMTKQAALEKV